MFILCNIIIEEESMEKKLIVESMEWEYDEELTEEELIEIEKSINLKNAINIMIEKRFAGNIYGINAYKNKNKNKNSASASASTFTSVFTSNCNSKEKPIDKKDKTFNSSKIDNKVESFRKQEEFGARKRIKP